MKIAIHSIFIMKENILFLEQWINYHSLLGFNEFYLYDNSKVQISRKGSHHYHKCFKEGKINKYNVNYDALVELTDNEIKEHVDKICKKYENVHIIEWSPKDSEGLILHNQVDGHNDCLNNYLKKNNIDWCANIDMDEYIVINNYDNVKDYILSLPSNVSSVSMGQIRFRTRFELLNKLVTDITEGEIKQVPRKDGNKALFNVQNTLRVKIHETKPANGFKVIHPDVNEICINHYKLNFKSYKHIDNINVNMKNKINKDSLIPIKGINYE